MPRTTTAKPETDRRTAEAARMLRAALEWADYDAEGVRALIGEVDTALLPAEREALWLWRARGEAPLPTLVRLFLLGRTVQRSAARRALGDALGAAEELGLVAIEGAEVIPRAELSLHGGLVVASDRLPGDAQPPRDYVHGPTTATLLLDRMTIRRPIGRALDLGTGTGYLAVRLASHTDEVVASDVTPRALAYAALNVVLNRSASVTTVRSDRFAAVAGQRFDLVTGNLPFVISPERRFTYRDGGEAVDGFFASVVRQTGSVLGDGGFAQYLGQWVHRDGEREEVRVAPWIVASGCDALILRLEREPIDRYAARWSAGPTSLDGRERGRRMRAWIRSYERAGITAISTGLWTLRRRETDNHYMLIDDAPEAPTGAEIRARFAAMDRTSKRAKGRRRGR